MVIASVVISVLSIAVSAYTVTISRRSIKRSNAATEAARARMSTPQPPIIHIEGVTTKGTADLVRHMQDALRKRPPDTRTLG